MESGNAKSAVIKSQGTPTTLSKNKRVNVKICIKGDKKSIESLKKAIDTSKIEDDTLVILFNSDDIGDVRAFVNSTLRVINASVNSLM